MKEFLRGLRQGLIEGPRIFFLPVSALARAAVRLSRRRRRH